jgi:hypothetical protein
MKASEKNGCGPAASASFFRGIVALALSESPKKLLAAAGL